jgi:hypothetical protein
MVIIVKYVLNSTVSRRKNAALALDLCAMMAECQNISENQQNRENAT